MNPGEKIDYDKELETLFERRRINKWDRKEIREKIKWMEDYDISTKEHLILTGLRGEKYAIEHDLEMNALLYPCLLHDIGKLFIRKEILNKPYITIDEMEEMKLHSALGYLVLKDRFRFSAGVIYINHWYNEEEDKKYPKRVSDEILLEALGYKNPKTIEKIKEYAMYLHIVDSKEAEKRKYNYPLITTLTKVEREM